VRGRPLTPLFTYTLGARDIGRCQPTSLKRCGRSGSTGRSRILCSTRVAGVIVLGAHGCLVLSRSPTTINTYQHLIHTQRLSCPFAQPHHDQHGPWHGVRGGHHRALPPAHHPERQDPRAQGGLLPAEPPQPHESPVHRPHLRHRHLLPGLARRPPGQVPAVRLGTTGCLMMPRWMHTFWMQHEVICPRHERLPTIRDTV
jgi:hypothetical protein